MKLILESRIIKLVFSNNNYNKNKKIKRKIKRAIAV